MAIRPHLIETAPWDTIDMDEAFCADRGVSMLTATFWGLLTQPGLTSVIAGVFRPERRRRTSHY